MKTILRRLLPQKCFFWFKRIFYLIKFGPSINQETKHYQHKVTRFSGTFREDRVAQLASLLVTSHVLEKGITMPNRRMGFGYERVRSIIVQCERIITRWGAGSVELQAALADLKQYLDIHIEHNFILPSDIKDGIEHLLQYQTSQDENCFTIKSDDFFKVPMNFDDFARSRHSVRWFADTPVDDEKLMAAIKLAQTAPSACNRQSSRIKIISSSQAKELCCDLQNGNRGFGDKADKWLLITTELGAWSHEHLEMAFIDAGIFTMNLLYALHFYGMVACTLNAHLPIKKRELLQKGLGYPESEIPAVFILVGNPTKEFLVPKSRRLNTKDIVQII